MGDLISTTAIAAILAIPLPLPQPDPAQSNWCTVGYTVMIPDGREGTVTSTSGEICRVLTDGEAYVTPLPYYIVERVYPQPNVAPHFAH